jgi:hypothetical protein
VAQPPLLRTQPNQHSIIECKLCRNHPTDFSSSKNNSLPPHSAYNKHMRFGEHRILSRLGSVLVVLCLLAAPLCATRCTLSSCAKPDNQGPSTTGCHHQSKHSRGSSVLAGAIAPTCFPADSFLTTLPAEQSWLLTADSDSHSLSAIPNSPSRSAASVLITVRISNRGSSPGIPASLLANPPLRL